jgi:hypothetical protein
VIPVGSGGGNDLDADGDGYTIAGGDCNDADAGVHPGIRIVTIWERVEGGMTTTGRWLPGLAV